MSAAVRPVQEAAIQQYAKQLRLPTLGGQFARLAGEAVKEQQSHLSYLEALLEGELEERERKAIARRIQEAHLPSVKTLEEFDFQIAPHIAAALVRNLSEGGYLARKEPVILLGETGTGKTHLATGLAVAACRQRKRVRFTTAAEMVTELIEAQNHAELTRVRNRWTRYDLIVIDELGYVVMPDTAAELLFQVIAGRAERAAVIVTTNTLCGAPHNVFNAESIFMRTPRSLERPRRHFAVFLLRILGAAFSISISLSVALKRPVRSFGAITDSRASSFTEGSARV